jgi:hypothetical protein
VVGSATTDSKGRFRITVAAGTYGIVSCGALGPAAETVTVADGQTTQHDIACSVP